MKEMLIILVSAILVDNFVLSKFMGIGPFLGVSKKNRLRHWNECCSYICYVYGNCNYLADLYLLFGAIWFGLSEHGCIYSDYCTICTAD